jgi:hypothetical protein
MRLQESAQARLPNSKELREAIRRYTPPEREVFNLWSIPNVSLYNISAQRGREWLAKILETAAANKSPATIKPLERVLERVPVAASTS